MALALINLLFTTSFEPYHPLMVTVLTNSGQWPHSPTYSGTKQGKMLCMILVLESKNGGN